MTLKITVELTLEAGFDRGAYSTFLMSSATLGLAEISAGDTPAADAGTEFGAKLDHYATGLSTTVFAGPGTGMMSAGTNGAAPEAEAEEGALDTGPETVEEQMAADAAEEAAHAAGTEPPKRRVRRTRAQIEADNAAATKRTLEAAAGLIPGTAPAAAAPTVAVPPGVAVPPAPPVAPVAVAPPAPVAAPPAQVAVPPGVAVAPQPVAQAPSMPAPAPTTSGITIEILREVIRQGNISHPGLAFNLQKTHGWFTPEMIPAENREWFISELNNKMATTPPVQR
jgi:hypothetical protein